MENVDGKILLQVVPYSDHSSFGELKRFVEAVRPRCVKPIVKSFSGDRSCINAVRGDMSVFDEYLDPSQPVSYVVNACHCILNIHCTAAFHIIYW